MPYAEALECAEAQKAKKASQEKAKSQVAQVSQSLVSNSQCFSQVVSTQQSQGGVSGEMSQPVRMDAESVLDLDGFLRAEGTPFKSNQVKFPRVLLILLGHSL